MNFRLLMGLALLVTVTVNLAQAQQPPIIPGQVAANPLETSFVARSTESQNPVSPAIQRRDSLKRTLWYASIAAAVGATAFDSASSWHKQEFNPLLASNNGTFGGRAVGIKIGAAAVTLIPQFILRKHKDRRTGFILGNLAETALFSGAAIHNLNIK
jgi:hypothetical protein